MTICLFETLAAFAVSCLLSAMIIPKISLVAFKRRLFDPPSDRKLHTTHIPRLGGIAFFPCITVPISLIIACHNLCTDSNLLCWEQSTCLLTMFSCLFILYLMGMKDDLIGMRYRAKFPYRHFAVFYWWLPAFASTISTDCSASTNCPTT